MPTPEGLYTLDEVKEYASNKIRERLAEEGDKLKEHKANAAKWQAEAETHQKRATELEAVAAKAGRLETDLLIARAGVNDPKGARRVAAMYAADNEDVPEGKRPALADWLASADGKAAVSLVVPAAPPAATPPADASKAPDSATTAPPTPAAPAAPTTPVVPPPTRAPSLPAPPPAPRLSREAHEARVKPWKEERARLALTPEGKASPRYQELTSLILQSGRESSQGA